MARIRSVKPEFWTDGVMVGLTVWARLFYIGSWNFACDRGHLPDDPMSLKLKILPADPVDVAELIAELIAAGRVERRTTRDGRSYLTIRRFMDHQKLDPRWTSKCPYCAAEAEGAPPPPPPSPLPPDPPDETHSNSGEARRDSPDPAEPQPRIGRDRSGGDRRSKNVASDAAHPPGVPDPPEPEAPPRLDVERVCQHLADRIEANGSKRPTITAKWRTAARLMFDADGRTVEQVTGAINWCQDDTFWRGNIMSMPKLREKYDQLSQHARRRPGNAVAQAGPYRGTRDIKVDQVDIAFADFEAQLQSGGAP